MNDDERDAMLIRMEQLTTDMHHALFGNGREGLVTQFERVKTQQATCPARNRSWTGIVSVVAAILSATAAIAAIILSI